MLTAETLVQREVMACVSSLVATLAQSAYGHVTDGTDLAALTEQAFELASPVLDYEESATQEGWRFTRDNDEDGGFWSHPDNDDCYGDPSAIPNIDPYEWEVYEHWIVSDWLADLLCEEGEKVDKDFTGLCVWARTTTGQAIAADSVIEHIVAKLNAEG